MPPRSSVARIQQIAVVTTLAAAAIWVALVLPVSLFGAALGALAIVCWHSWVLGVEFLLQAYIAIDDPAPRATGRQRLRAWAVETVDALRVFGWRQPFQWRAIDDQLVSLQASRTGVVFIHGFGCNRGFWSPWMRRLQGSGRRFEAINLEPPFGSIDEYAVSLEAAVTRVTRASGGAPPILICHSMGGLVVRTWLRSQSSTTSIARVITIATPHQGTWLARFGLATNARQMRIGSAWMTSLQRDWSSHPAQLFTCWYSNCDNVVMPPSSATLPGADNRFVPGAAHVELAFCEDVIAGSLALLDSCDRVPDPLSRSSEGAQEQVRSRY
ncbi:alpha/beta fold hydrolase [Ramlibacter sp. AW1]|uniref:Alpha/beta fold hydrolase n=1 Tax=Ramlibacter aurantiacus TaxID=2801330 RepID=A0A936ZSJ7_9BURK|nr:alpha/beta fold hydrolase [Ramlibacter aurantiacus]MBL0421781.1 alpha/beta fold hydrolase [Ramlibacter aurantiacus]